MKKHRIIRKITVFLLCLVVMSGAWVYFWLFFALPSPEKLDDYLLASGNYPAVTLADMPEALQWATIVVEDKNFYSRDLHIDFPSLLRGIWYRLDCAMSGCMEKQAVTIPQQLAANLMLLSNQTKGSSLRQDLRTLALTLMITGRYTSDEILEFYLNSIPYRSDSNQIYGVEAAAQFYYAKHISDLDLAECAMLQAITHLAYFDPKKHLEIARQRQSIVLDLMVEEGYIEERNAASAEQQVLTFTRQIDTRP